MNVAVQQEIITAFLVFCRVGTCMMILPGIGGERIAPQVRLFVALAISFAIVPVVDKAAFGSVDMLSAMLVVYVVGEVIVGAFFGFLVRVFYLALEFFAIAMANFAGYGSVFMQSIDDSSGTTAYSELIMLPALALFFILNLHIAVIEMLQTSYDVVKVGRWMGSLLETNILIDALRNSFVMTLQVSAPLILYSLTVNLVLGLVSKLIPQIPIYFVSAPFLVFGGLLMLFETDGAILSGFTASVLSWIQGLAADG